MQLFTNIISRIGPRNKYKGKSSPLSNINTLFREKSQFQITHKNF